jgi:preprotein translocase subunit SecE
VNYITLSILFVVAIAVFAVLWRQGAFLKIAAYWDETKEELKKCTWPTVEELKGSTTIVIVSIVLMGAFTIGVDLVFTAIIRSII